jgi:hypothetical protein
MDNGLSSRCPRPVERTFTRSEASSGGRSTDCCRPGCLNAPERSECVLRLAHALWHLGIRSDHVGHNRGPADGGCASLARCRACARDPRGVRRSRPTTTSGVTSRPPTIDSFSSPALVRELSHFLGLHHLIRTSEKVLLRRDGSTSTCRPPALHRHPEGVPNYVLAIGKRWGTTGDLQLTSSKPRGRTDEDLARPPPSSRNRSTPAGEGASPERLRWRDPVSESA